MPEQDPANPQPFMNFPSEAVRQRLDARLKSLPIQNAIRQSLGQELGKLLNAETLNATFQDLVTGRTSLDQSLQQLATTASQVLDTVMQAEQQQSDQENHINQQLQVALQQDKVSIDRNNYVIHGQVLKAETQEKLAGLLVQVTHENNFLGLAITNQDGNFEIDLGTKKFHSNGENPPKVILEVSTDRKTLLHKREITINDRPKKIPPIVIDLPIDQAEIAQQMMAQNPQPFLDQLQTVTRSIAHTQYQHLQTQAIGDALKTELSQFLNKPEP
jgi:hypothetical protein